MISVVVPFRPATPWRNSLWEHCRVPLERNASVELIVESDDGGRNAGEFNHPRAINRGVARATNDVVAIIDADVLIDEDWLSVASDMVADGEVPWVLPRLYVKLTEDSTKLLLAGEPWTETEWVGDSVSWAGVIVVRRDDFEMVGGYDERISWWGSDDMCAGLTFDTLIGPVHRLEGSVIHLHHPAPLSETYGHQEHQRQYALSERYRRAAGDPDAIWQLRREDLECR